jgi:excisionase family DNA binding protein
MNIMETNEPAFLTLPQAAQRLGVSPRTARRLIADEGVPAVKLRGTLRIPWRSLDEWIALQERRSVGTAQ